MMTNSNKLNKLRGSVFEVNSDFIKVISQGIMLRGVSSNYPPNVGETVTLLIPSTRFIVSINDRHLDPYYEALHLAMGRVIDISNRGELVDYKFDTRIGILIVTQPSTETKFSKGDYLYLYWNQKDCLINVTTSLV